MREARNPNGKSMRRDKRERSRSEEMETSVLGCHVVESNWVEDGVLNSEFADLISGFI